MGFRIKRYLYDTGAYIWHDQFHDDAYEYILVEKYPWSQGEIRKYIKRKKHKENKMIEDKREVNDVLNERRDRYGEFENNASLSQQMKRIVRSNENYKNMPDYTKEGVDNIIQKMARAISGDFKYTDNWVDVQGYAKLIVDAINKRANE